MDIRRTPPFSVFDHFRRFWKEVDALRELALMPPAAPSAAPAAPSAAPEAQALVQVPTTVRDRLALALRRQEAEVGRFARDGELLDMYRETQYVMVAVADEVFVRLPWSGASHWAQHLLEMEHFGTRSAGQEIFTRIDRLLLAANPAQVELAAVYLTALALGFRGRFSDRPDAGAIAEYRRQLYQFVFGKTPDTLAHPMRRLLQPCYDTTLTAGSGRKLRNPRTWWWASAAVLVLWLMVSHGLWVGLTSPLQTRIETILGKAAQLDRQQR
jgi:type VI secretion system protein ImpK